MIDLSQQDTLRSLLCYWHERRLSLEFRRTGLQYPQAGPRIQKGVPQDTKHPCAEICSWLERRESLERLGISFLYKILGLLAISCQPHRKVIERVEERHRVLLERLRVIRDFRHCLPVTTGKS